MRRPRRLAFSGAATVALLLLIAPLSGCTLIAAPFLAFGQERTKKVPPEYPYLDGKKVCLLVWAEQYTEFEHRWVRLEVSEHVRVALDGSVPGISIIPTAR